MQTAHDIECQGGPILPDDVVDTYCGYDDCKGQDGDGWSDADVWYIDGDSDLDENTVNEYKCHTCKRAWRSTYELSEITVAGCTHHGLKRIDQCLED